MNMHERTEAMPASHAGEVLELSPEQMEVTATGSLALNENLLIGFTPGDKRARAFNLLRTQVAKRIAAKGHKLVGIASATPDAGKSFIAINLAAALARLSEERVLLVDLDLRRGSVGASLGIQPEIGISDYLAGHVPTLQSVGRHIEGANLDVLLTNPVGSESAELLTRPTFDRLLDNLRVGTGNSVVFCDMPPAFANDDAMLTMQKLDAFIFVVDAGRNNKKQVQNALAMFAPTPCIGTFLNRYVVVMLALGFGLFALGIGYAYACERL